jgi:phytoene synthase
MNNTLMDYAGNTISVGSKSFATAAKLFDATTRRSVLMLYAWCRHCDDVIDDQALGFNVAAKEESPAEQRLERLKNQTRRAWEGGTMTEPAFAAFQLVIQGWCLPDNPAPYRG